MVQYISCNTVALQNSFHFLDSLNRNLKHRALFLHYMTLWTVVPQVLHTQYSHWTVTAIFPDVTNVVSQMFHTQGVPSPHTGITSHQSQVTGPARQLGWWVARWGGKVSLSFLQSVFIVHSGSIALQKALSLLQHSSRSWLIRGVLS